MVTKNVALLYSRATSEGTLHTAFHQNCFKHTIHMLDYKDTRRHTKCGTLKFNTETECDTENIWCEAFGRRRVMEKGLPMPNINTSLLV